MGYRFYIKQFLTIWLQEMDRLKVNTGLNSIQQGETLNF